MTFAHLQPLTNVPINYQLPTPYGFPDIARTGFYRSRSLQQGQRSNQGYTMMQSITNVPTKYQSPTSYGCRDIAQTRFSKSRSKVKSRSHQDVAHQHPLTNVPTKYQLPTPYGFSDTAPTNFFSPPIHPPWVKTIPLKGCGIKM